LAANALHHALELPLGHLAVSDSHASLGSGIEHSSDRVVDRLHAVGHEVDLPAPLDLAPDGAGHDVGVVLAHVHLDREAVGRRRIDDAHVAHARKRHLQRARDGCGGHGEHVDLLAQVLEVLLVLNTEPLLLVDDHEPEVVWVSRRPRAADACR
jgi:hypothetical protein